MAKNNNNDNKTKGREGKASKSFPVKGANARGNTRGNSGNRASDASTDSSRNAATRASFNSVLNDNINDIEWYASHPELLMDAGSISWFRPLGDRLDLFAGALEGGGTPSPTLPTVPGIMTFKTVLTPGQSVNNVSALNIAARNIYGDLRSVNAGSKNYDPADYMLYILACDAVYAWLAWLRRLYKQINIASMYNKYISRALVQSEGVDYDDLLANISGFRWYINNIQVRMSALAIPGDLPFNRRHMYMYSNLFSDSPNQKGQIYKFVPSGCWVYQEMDGPGYLKYVHLPTQRLTFERIRQLTESMLTSLLSSEDIGVMSGDTLKYYGADRLFMMEPLLPEEFIVPIYNPEFLDQIHNMTVLGVPLTNMDGSDLTITQVATPGVPNEGALICSPYFSGDASTHIPNIWNTDVIFNVENPDPDPAQTMILSRLAVRAVLTSPNLYNLSVFATEVVEQAFVWKFENNGGLTGSTAGPMYVSAENSLFNLTRFMLLITQSRAFDRHPMHFYFVQDSDVVRLVDSDVDYSNYTSCSPLVLQKLHESALLSLFRVPIVGTRARSLG